MRFTFGLLTAIVCASQVQAGATLDRVTRSGVVNDVLVDDYPPFGYINGENELAGFDVDVAQKVAARLGVNLHLATPGWETIVSGRWQARWDICICSMSPTEARAQVLDFPARYYYSPAVLVVHKDERRIRSIADISGKRVGVGTGSSYENYLNKSLLIPGAAPIVYPFQDVTVIPGDETVTFRNLALGPGLRLDAVVSNLATARANIESTHLLKIVDGTLYTEPNVVATEKGDPEWNAAVARTIAALKANGTLEKISRKWFGADITRDARWGIHRLSDTEPMIDDVRDDQQHRVDDRGAAGTARDQKGIAILEHDGRGHRGQGSLAGDDGICLPLHQPVRVLHVGLGRKVVHFIVEKESGSRYGHPASPEAVERIRDAYGIAGGIDDGEVRSVGRFVCDGVNAHGPRIV
jgi:polar amino acid transport system substrate-binding protein